MSSVSGSRHKSAGPPDESEVYLGSSFLCWDGWMKNYHLISFFICTVSHHPLTNYYQYSLGVLALCVSNVRVNNHVTNKLIKAAQHEHFTHGDTVSVGE